MNRERSQFLILTIALTASLLLHAVVILPMIIAGMNADADVQHISQSEVDDATTLGLDESKQSTLDWVGYEEYEKHIAQFSETNQPELSIHFPIPSSPTPQPLVGEPPQMPQLPPATALIQLDPPKLDSPSPDAVLVSPAEPSDLSLMPNDSVEPPEHRPAVTENDSPPHAPSHVQPPVDTPAVEVSEKETDATSTIKVTREQWQQGKPLAAEGIELIPQKPEFTTLTLITALPRNTTGRITINHRGKVTHAEIVRSSANQTVDRNIIDALYGWSARGQRIDAMTDDETIELDIQFVLIR